MVTNSVQNQTSPKGSSYSGERTDYEESGSSRERKENNWNEEGRRSVSYEVRSSGQDQEYHYDGSPVERTYDDRIVVSREGRRRYSTYETVPSGYEERSKFSSRKRSASLDRGSAHFRDNGGISIGTKENMSAVRDSGESNLDVQQDVNDVGSYENFANISQRNKENDGEVKSKFNQEKFHLTNLNLNSADVRRRIKEKEFVDEAIQVMKLRKMQKKREEMLEKKQNMEMLKSYNPWGKPGAGAPPGTEVYNKEKLFNNLHKYERKDEDDEKDLLTFGKPGYGAPIRSKSGRRVTQLKSDAGIRFQENEHVRKSVENHYRYKKDSESQKSYHKDLDRFVQFKEESKKTQNEISKSQRDLVTPEWKKDPPSIRRKVYPDDPQGYTYDPWGKGIGHPQRDNRGNVRRFKFAPSKDHGVREYTPPITPESTIRSENRGGAGAPIKAENGKVRTHLPVTLDGQSLVKEAQVNTNEETFENFATKGHENPYNGKKFIEKLGWATSGQPHRRSNTAKKEYLNSLQQGMKQKEQKEQEEHRHNKDGGMELASLMKNAVIGKPKRDPNSGEIIDHRKMRQEDFLQNGYEFRYDPKVESKLYHDQLTYQTEVKKIMNETQKFEDNKKSSEHQESWNEYWGKLGNGAPNSIDNHHRGQPSSMPDAYEKEYPQNILRSNHVNRYEVDSRKEIKGQKEYKFKIPFASVNSD